MTHTPPSNTSITGIILAGGRGQRMGEQDKGLMPLQGKPLLEYALDTLRPQVSEILISANRNLAYYAHYGYPVVEDQREGFHGPLAGIESALAQVHTPYALCLPCDCPHAPADLGQRLLQALLQEQADIAVAHDGRRVQPLFILMHRHCLETLSAALERDERRALAWIQNLRHVMVDFSDQAQAFDNLNTIDSLETYRNEPR